MWKSHVRLDFAIVLGQALLFGGWRLMAYGGLFWLACHLYVILYEEPTLQRTFGAGLRPFVRTFRAAISRLSPWQTA